MGMYKYQYYKSKCLNINVWRVKCYKYNKRGVSICTYTGQIKIWDISTFGNRKILKNFKGLKKREIDE
jgi:hypothetical protein